MVVDLGHVGDAYDDRESDDEKHGKEHAPGNPGLR
jgi:hypothetical protein